MIFDTLYPINKWPQSHRYQPFSSTFVHDKQKQMFWENHNQKSDLLRITGNPPYACKHSRVFACFACATCSKARVWAAAFSTSSASSSAAFFAITARAASSLAFFLTESSAACLAVWARAAFSTFFPITSHRTLFVQMLFKVV